jgi:hypothetical protein
MYLPPPCHHVLHPQHDEAHVSDTLAIMRPLGLCTNQGASSGIYPSLLYKKFSLQFWPPQTKFFVSAPEHNNASTVEQVFWFCVAVWVIGVS